MLTHLNEFKVELAEILKPNFPLAIQSYTEAPVEEPRAPRHYISRSVAYARLKPENGGPNYQAALEDAEVALSIEATITGKSTYLRPKWRIKRSVDLQSPKANNTSLP